MGSVGSSRGHDLDKVPRFYLQQVDIGRSRGTLHYCLASQARPCCHFPPGRQGQGHRGWLRAQGCRSCSRELRKGGPNKGANQGSSGPESGVDAAVVEDALLQVLEGSTITLGGLRCALGRLPCSLFSVHVRSDLKLNSDISSPGCSWTTVPLATRVSPSGQNLISHVPSLVASHHAPRTPPC